MPWGLMLLREAVPDHSALLAGDWEALDEKKQLTVSVDWGPLGAEMAPAQLVVRQGGIEIASASGRAPHALSVCFSIAHMAPDGGCLRPASGPGRARVHVTGGCQPPEYYSGAAAAAFLFLHDTGYGTGTKSCRDRLVR